MAKDVDFIAMLEYKATEDGGRKTPAFSGIRPAIKFTFSDYLTSGEQKFIDRNIVFPGEMVKAEIRIIAVDAFKNCLEEGMRFDFREGSKITGTGTIVEVVNETLRKAH